MKFDSVTKISLDAFHYLYKTTSIYILGVFKLIIVVTCCWMHLILKSNCVLGFFDFQGSLTFKYKRQTTTTKYYKQAVLTKCFRWSKMHILEPQSTLTESQSLGMVWNYILNKLFVCVCVTNLFYKMLRNQATKRVDENCCATLSRSTATLGVFLFLHELNLYVHTILYTHV